MLLNCAIYAFCMSVVTVSPSLEVITRKFTLSPAICADEGSCSQSLHVSEVISTAGAAPESEEAPLDDAAPEQPAIANVAIGTSNAQTIDLVRIRVMISYLPEQLYRARGSSPSKAYLCTDETGGVERGGWLRTHTRGAVGVDRVKVGIERVGGRVNHPSEQL